MAANDIILFQRSSDNSVWEKKQLPSSGLLRLNASSILETVTSTSVGSPSVVFSSGPGRIDQLHGDIPSYWKSYADIRSLVLGTSVTYIGSDAFYSNPNLVGSVVIPNSVISIGTNSFSQSSITSVTIPSSVTAIDSYSFYYCSSLTDLYIDTNFSYVGLFAFFGSGLTTVHVKPANYVSQGWTLGAGQNVGSATVTVTDDYV